MNEKEFDKKVMETLISLHDEADEQVTIFGEETICEHSPEILNRRDKLKGFIVNYAQHYFEGLAYAEHMSVSEIAETITSSGSKKQ